MRTHLLFALIFGILSAAGTAPSYAEGPKALPVSYEDVLRHALSQSPAIREIDSELAERLADGIELSSFSNPEVEAEIRPAVASKGSADETETAVSISQPLRLSQFGVRAAVADAINRTARSDHKIAILRLSQEIRLGYVKLWTLRERMRQLESAKTRASRIARFLDEAAKKGLLGPAESALFVAEQRRIEADQMGLQADDARAEAELLRLSAYPGPLKDLLPLSLPELPESFSDMSSAPRALPEAERAKLALELASKQAELARKDRFPRFAPIIGYERTGEGTDYIGIGIAFELPFFDRNQPERLKRVAEQEAARQKHSYFEGEAFRREAALFFQSAKDVDAQAKAYRDRVLPALTHAVESYEKLLRAGQGSMLQLWQSQKELYGAQERYLELLSEAVARRVMLSVFLGKEV